LTDRRARRLWVKSGPDALEVGCLFYRRITDLSQTSRHVRKVPIADVAVTEALCRAATILAADEPMVVSS